MKSGLNSVVLAAALVLTVQPAAQGASQQQQRQPQGQQQQQQGRRGGGPPIDPVERERLVRQALTQRMRGVLQLPDSTLSRLAALTFRYRDSTLYLQERERFVRRELEYEQRAPSQNRTPNESRITCLMDTFWNIQQTRMNVRLAEDREIKAFISPLKRLQYFGMQENLHDAMENVIERLNERRGGRNQQGVRGDSGSAPPPGARGRGGPPPDGARPGGPPGGRLGGPPGGRGQFAAICPR